MTKKMDTLLNSLFTYDKQFAITAYKNGVKSNGNKITLGKRKIYSIKEENTSNKNRKNKENTKNSSVSYVNYILKYSKVYSVKHFNNTFLRIEVGKILKWITCTNVNTFYPCIRWEGDRL